MPNSAKRRAVFVNGLSAVSGLAMAAALMIPPAYSAGDPMTEFFNAGYNFCDAKLIAAYWGVGFDQAKADAGQKIIDRGKEGKKAVNQIIKEGRKIAACEWVDTQHSYEEAELLATYWGMSDPSEAKAKVARLYTEGNAKQVRKALKAAQAS
jgi:hypothetical protein